MRNFQHSGRSTIHSLSGMAATSSPQASLTAVTMLRAGGNAVDAAVAAAAVLCITEPAMTGIGGDCFVLLGKPDGTVVGLNGAGRAAKGADAEWLRGARLSGMPPNGALSVTVPGAVDAWDRLLKAHGTVTLGEALSDAIRIAEEGAPVHERVARDWAKAEDALRQDEGGSRHLLPGGRTPQTGDAMRYPALARTFRILAEKGRDAFYAGEIAEDILGCLGGKGSLLQATDFEATEATWVEPVSTAFADHEILEIPPSGQGITALVALNVLKRLDIGRYDPQGTDRRHLTIEAMRLAWSLRDRYIGDPDASTVPVDMMLSDRTADELAGRVRLDHAMEPSRALAPLPHSDTTYLTVVDRNRLAVSFINSLYDSFGSGIVTPKTGIALQNRGACFVTTPGHPNCIGPGKRPLHTIIPAMARRSGTVVMSFGVMGGAYQPMGHLEVAVNRFVHGMDIQQALDFPRVFPMEGFVAVEEAVPEAAMKGLQRKGHVLALSASPLGSGQIIEIDRERGVLHGASDFRRDGQAIGF